MLTYPGKWDNLQEMERTPLGNGLFLIESSPEEIRERNRFMKISLHQGLIALSASRKESAVDPEEIRELNIDIQRHIEIIDRLMSASSDHQT